jgi:sigma-B regulation protein RsbU (phosphoserine phosphatase)
MSGISGDLYDFYLDDDTLSGISLFDVSGHGIASGLITMLAKSILFRTYNSNMDQTPK